MDTPQQLPVEAARKQFAELLNGSQFRGEHTEITRHGKAAGYLVPPDWYERAKQALAEPPTMPKNQIAPGSLRFGPPVPGSPAAFAEAVGKLTDRQAAELAARAFASADPRQYETLSDAVRDGDHAVVEAALETGLLTTTDLLAS